MKLPILIIFCVALLFHYLGISFFAGIGVLLLAFGMNLRISGLSARAQTQLMKF